MAGRIAKSTRELLKQLPGWTHSMTGRHLKLTHDASGQSITTSKTPSDVRSYRNAIARCRRIEKEHEDG